MLGGLIQIAKINRTSRDVDGADIHVKLISLLRSRFGISSGIIRPEMKRVPARKAKETKPTREEILKAINWKPVRLPGVPAAVVKAENRRIQDYIVNWTQGLASHIEKVEAAERARNRAQRKRANASLSHLGTKKRARGGC